MADVELLHTPPAREPTFFKPLDAASRRRSRASHDSAAASTRSWVIMNQQSPPPPAEPIPVPDPVPALVPTPTSRPLPTPPRRTSAVGDEAGPEYMTVEMPTDAEAEAGYQWATGRGAKAHAHKGFVGGFVSGLRRLPRALVRPRTRARRGTLHTEAETEDTEGTGMTGNTLPRYVSNPTTPVVPSPTMGFARRGINERENVDAGRRPRHPSFRVVPPAEDVMQQDPMPIGDDAQQGRGDVEAGPSVLDFPQTPLENPYDRDATSIHVPTAAPSPRPSRADDRLTVPLDGDTDEPASVQVHPLPTEDYRRMSAADAAQPQSRTTITSVLSSFSADSPSFSSELNNGPQRFLNALHVLPWVATNRVTTDYVPKAKPRPLVSWYHPVGEGEAAVAQHARTLDANAATSSASPETARPRHRTPQQHRRVTTLPELPASAPPTYGVPLAYYPAFSPSPPPSPPPPPTRHQPSPPPQPRRRAHRHHHRRSASPTYHPSHTQALSMPMPVPAWAPLPAPPAPVYIIRATPPSSVHATPGSAHSSPAVHSASPPAHGSPRSDASAPKQMLVAPVYMQMQVSPGAPHQLAFVHGGGGGDVRYPYGYAPYGYAYSGGSGGEAGSPIAMPPPVQTVGG